MESLAQCWDLQLLDLTGSNGIEDEAGKLFSSGEIQQGEASVKPGFGYMTIMKLASTNISDIALIAMTKICPALEHLEVQRCERLTEYGVKAVLENNLELKFFDINKIPVVNYGFLDEL